MDSRRRQTTVRQLESLLQFAEEHRDLALGRLRSKTARDIAARLWYQCAQILNAQGPKRVPREWSKVWNDLKCRVRQKVVTNKESEQKGELFLSPLEARVVNILRGACEDSCYKVPNDSMATDMPSLTPKDEHDDPLSASEQDCNFENSTPSDDEALIQLATPKDILETQDSVERDPDPVPTRRRPRRLIKRRALSPTTQTSSSSRSLEDSRRILARIEETRARAEASIAEAAVRKCASAEKQAEAALIQARAAMKRSEAEMLKGQALNTIAEAFKMLVPPVMKILSKRARESTDGDS